MPEISRFYGIIIYMYFKDHAPPHFHVKYNEYQAVVSIEDFAITKGKLPSKAIGLVMEWATIHQEELIKNWKSLSESDVASFTEIEPLN
jgi:Domain of unknown function (DUF4160)